MAGKNTLYYGDNLEALRLYIKGDSVDLIYLDPPAECKMRARAKLRAASAAWSLLSHRSLGQEQWPRAKLSFCG